MAIAAYIIAEHVPLRSRGIVAPFARIRVHRGGDPEGLGRTLLDYYLPARRVNRLISLGWLDRVGKTLACFDINDPGSTVAWYRDRGGTAPILHWDDDLEELLPHPHNEIPWVYQFRSGRWWCASSENIHALRLEHLPSCSAFDELEALLRVRSREREQA